MSGIAAMRTFDDAPASTLRYARRGPRQHEVHPPLERRTLSSFAPSCLELEGRGYGVATLCKPHIPERKRGIRIRLSIYSQRCAAHCSSDGTIRIGTLSSHRVDGREGGRPAQERVRPPRLRSGGGCGVRCNDHVLKLKERVGRMPISLLGGLFLKVVERSVGNPSLGERLVPRAIRRAGLPGRTGRSCWKRRARAQWRQPPRRTIPSGHS